MRSRRTLTHASLLLLTLGATGACSGDSTTPEGGEPDASVEVMVDAGDEQDAEPLDAELVDATTAATSARSIRGLLRSTTGAFRCPGPPIAPCTQARRRLARCGSWVSSGTVLNFDGTGLKGVVSATDLTLRAIHALSASDVWAVGDESTLVHYDGSAFSLRSQPAAADAGARPPALRGVWASAADDVWAVGDLGGLWHFDGQSFASQMAPSTDSLNAIFGLAKDKVFAVGSSSALLTFDGSSWKKTTLPGAGVWSALHGLSASDLWVVGNQGRVLHYDGTSWIPVELTLPKVDLLAVREISPSEVVVSGKGGALYVYDGSVWHTRTSGTTSDQLGLVQGDTGELFTLGARGSFLRWQGDTRTSFTAGSDRNRLDLFGKADGKGPLWIVGDETLRLIDGSYDDSIDPGTERSLYGGFALADNLAWAVGTAGTIVRWNGGKFEPLTSGTDKPLRSMWAASPTSLGRGR